MILVFLLMCTCHPVKCWLADVCSAQIKSRIQNRGSRSIWIIVIIYFSLFFFVFYYSNIYLQVIYVIKMRNTIYVKVRDNTKLQIGAQRKNNSLWELLKKSYDSYLWDSFLYPIQIWGHEMWCHRWQLPGLVFGVPPLLHNCSIVHHSYKSYLWELFL